MRLFHLKPDFSSAIPGLAVACLGLVGCSRPKPPVPPKPGNPISRVLSAVVKIEAIQMRPLDGRLVKTEVGGSGVIVASAGYVLTNFHVAENADYFRCFLTDGRRFDARLIGDDPPTDLAVLRLEGQGAAGTPPSYPSAVFGRSADLKVGDVVFALGSPAFLAQTVTRGIVSDPSADLPSETVGRLILHGEDIGMVVRWILHDARIFPGNSGGPLVNARGEVVGINEIGVADLGGAIPGDLAHAVANQLIATGSVTRGWSGLTVQPRLEADGLGAGVCVADVTAGSPAARAGLEPGDVIVACNGRPIRAQRELAVAEYYRREMAGRPGSAFPVDFIRGGARHSVSLVLGRRMPAETDNVESKPWGLVTRGITRHLALLEQLPDTHGVEVVSVQPGGPAGQAEPPLEPGDVIVQVNDKELGNAAAFAAVTASELKGARGGVRNVAALVRRAGALIATVVRLRRETEPPEVVPEVRKGWLGIDSQPLTSRLAAHWHIHGPGGVRITRIFPKTTAARSALRVGDIVLEIEGDEIPARREEDAGLFARMVRDYDPGSQATLTVWRAGARLQVPVQIEREPKPPEEMATWDDRQLEFTVRQAAFSDLVRLQLDPGTQGVLVAEVVPSGWAALGGLMPGDLILRADGKPVATLAAFRAARQGAVDRKEKWLVLLLRRDGATLFVEINLKPILG